MEGILKIKAGKLLGLYIEEATVQILVKYLADGYFSAVSGQTNAAFTENAIRLVRLNLYNFLCLQEGPASVKFNERVLLRFFLPLPSLPHS